MEHVVMSLQNTNKKFHVVSQNRVVETYVYEAEKCVLSISRKQSDFKSCSLNCKDKKNEKKFLVILQFCFSHLIQTTRPIKRKDIQKTLKVSSFKSKYSRLQPTAWFMTHVTCRLTAKNRDQLRNPTLGNRVWATFYLLH